MIQLPDKITAFNWGTRIMKVDVVDKRVMLMRPTEIHLKENGALDNTPSLAIVMDTQTLRVVGEVSLNMLNEGLKSIGYELKKTEV